MTNYTVNLTGDYQKHGFDETVDTQWTVSMYNPNSGRPKEYDISLELIIAEDHKFFGACAYTWKWEDEFYNLSPSNLYEIGYNNDYLAGSLMTPYYKGTSSATIGSQEDLSFQFELRGASIFNGRFDSFREDNIETVKFSIFTNRPADNWAFQGKGKPALQTSPPAAPKNLKISS